MTSRLATWPVVPLEDVVNVLDHRRVPLNKNERDKRRGSVPYYGATGRIDWVDEPLFNQELVLLGEDGAPFLDRSKPKAYTVSGPCWVNNHAHVLVPKPELMDQRFLKYCLDSVDYRGHVSGTTRLKLNQTRMRQLPVVLPPLEQQRRVVSALDAHWSRLESAVGSLGSAQKRLRRLRRATLEAAVRGQLITEQASDEPAGMLLKRILHDRRLAWECEEHEKAEAEGKQLTGSSSRTRYHEPAPAPTQELPSLPAGWEWATLDAVADVQSGIQKQPRRAPAKNKYPFLRVANVARGKLDLQDVHEVELFEGELSRYELQPGDLLIVEGNGSPEQIGRCALWHGTIEHCVHQNHLIRARPVQGLLGEYLALYWNSPQGSRKVRAEAQTTSGLYTLSTSKVKRIPVPLPPTEEQSRIVAEVERRMSFIDAAEREVAAQLDQAKLLRRSLLHAAFSGRLVAHDCDEEPTRGPVAKGDREWTTHREKTEEGVGR